MAPKPKFLTEALQVVNQARSSMALLDALNLLRNPRSSASDIAQALEFDPQLTDHIVVEANSPFFGLRNKVESVQHAIALLGFKRIHELLTKTKQKEMYKNVENSYFEMISFKRHGVAVGCFAEQLAVALKLDKPEEFYEAGSMHDVGKYLYLVRASKEFEKIVDESRRTGTPLYEVERRLLGTDHCELGNMIADEWGLSDNIRAAIRYHHGITDKELERLTTREATIMQIVTYANLLSHGARFGNASGYHRESSDLPARPSDSLDAKDIQRVKELAENQYAELVRSMGLENNV